MAASLFGTGVSTASSTVTLPASITGKMFGVFFDRSISTGAYPTSVIPTGWTQLGTTQDVNNGTLFLRWIITYRFMTGIEGGTTLTGMATNASSSSKFAVVFTFASGVWLPPVLGGTAASLSTLANQTINTSSSPAGIAVACGDDFTAPLTAMVMTPAGTYGDNGTERAGYIVYASSPTNNTVSSGATGGGVLGCLWLPFDESPLIQGQAVF
jgi:hypothetical protein